MDVETADSPARNLPGVFVRTFGCQMNEHDSQKILAVLSHTHRPVFSAEEAELILVNTCSVREKAENKVYSLLGTWRELKERRPELVIGVGGCVAQQEGEHLVRRHPFVDFVVGTHNISVIPELVEDAKAGRGPRVVVDYRQDWESLPDFGLETSGRSFDRDLAEASGLEGSWVRALVAIQRGCDKQCAFCVVPTTRGPELSRLPEAIEAEIKAKVALGAKEVLLLGQTVNSYGRDFQRQCSFADLIRRIAAIDGLRRIRFTSPHPADVDPEFIALYAEVPKLCPHIHLPLQSASDRILGLMNRTYDSKQYRLIVDQLREQCPAIAFSTDIIVGFPTETEEDFEKTLEMVADVRYNSSYSFVYSERPNTLASRLFKAGQIVERDVAHERLLRLQSLQNSISAELNALTVGSEVEVLVEGRSKRISSRMRGRSPQNIWVEIADTSSGPGDVVSVAIESAGPHGLFGWASAVV